jgi:hypothetical protein
MPNMTAYCTSCDNCQISNEECVDVWIGDGYCDDYNNKAACQWDGRDCCDITNTNPEKDKYCEDCDKCVASSTCVDAWIGDGYCDDYNNKASCQWDGRDCCNITDPKPNMTTYCTFCDNCNVSEQDCVDVWIGDGYCDDYNNKAACNFDNGDCCSSVVTDWNKFCTDCNCSTTATTCEDQETEKKCNKWKKKGKCSKNATAMKCKQTCGKC